MAFPKLIYVTEGMESSDGTRYLIAHDQVEDIDEELNGDVVAVYELVKKQRLMVSKNLK